MQEEYNLPIEALNLSAKTISVLKAAGIDKIEDAVELLYGGPPALQAVLSEDEITEFIEAMRARGIIQ